MHKLEYVKDLKLISTADTAQRLITQKLIRIPSRKIVQYSYHNAGEPIEKRRVAYGTPGQFIEAGWVVDNVAKQYQKTCALHPHRDADEVFENLGEEICEPERFYKGTGDVEWLKMLSRCLGDYLIHLQQSVGRQRLLDTSYTMLSTDPEYYVRGVIDFWVGDHIYEIKFTGLDKPPLNALLQAFIYFLVFRFLLRDPRVRDVEGVVAINCRLGKVYTLPVDCFTLDQVRIIMEAIKLPVTPDMETFFRK